MKNYISTDISLESLSIIFEQAPVALAFLMGENFVIEAANPKMIEVWGKDDIVLGQPLLTAIPELEGQIFIELLQNVLRTGVPYRGDKASVYLDRNGISSEYFFDFIYAPIYNRAHTAVTGVSVVATDVTDQVRTNQQLEASNFRYQELVKNSDYSIAIYSGKDLIIEFANDMMLKTWGKDSSVRGKKLDDALPELKGQPYLDILRNIYETGKSYHASEDPVDLVVDGELQTFYYNFSYKPLKDAEGNVYAILNNAVNVTELVKSRKMVEESEKVLKTFVDNVPMAVSVMEGPDYVIKISNETTRKIWGGPEHRINLPVAAAYPGIVHRTPYKNLEKVRETKCRLVVRELEINESLGQRFINYILHPLLDENNEVTHVISIAYDVTEDILSQKKLEASEERFRGLADSIPQFVWTAEKNGYVDYFNKKWYEYTNFSKELSGDESWEQVLHPDHLSRTKEMWEQSVATGTNYEIEYQFKDFSKPGEFRWFLGRAVPIKNSEGDVIKWMGTCTDIDDFKQLESLKDSFLAIASHELKTPLTSLKLYSQFIEKNLRLSGDTKNADVARKMDLQINKLTSLIRDLLDVTKIQNGKLELHTAEFDADQMTEDVVEEQQMNSRHKISVYKEHLGTITGDPHRISQVLANLISNAIKYSPGADEIVITAARKDDKLTFCVRDFGIGIPAENREKIFQQYYRVSGSKERTFPGIGLGLFISSEIIRRSNGKIYLKEVEVPGSLFCFEIPVMPNSV